MVKQKDPGAFHRLLDSLTPDEEDRLRKILARPVLSLKDGRWLRETEERARTSRQAGTKC